MGWEGWSTLAIVLLIVVALARNIGPPDALLLGGAVAAGLIGMIAGTMTPADIFGGFANEGMLTVAALFVVAAGLRETGALDAIGNRILGGARNDRSVFLRLAGSTTVLSAFLNNTPIVAMFTPIVTDWCRKHRVSPSRLLMPLSYLTILGGTCTLIGTSTNLVVSGLMIRDGDPRLQAGIGMFELAWLGVPYALIGITYMLLIGRRLLPDRKDLLEQLGETSREYLVDVLIQPGCRLIGQRVEEAGLRRLPGLFLIEITRDGRTISPVGPDEILEARDRLTFTGVVSTIVDLERIPGLVAVPADDRHDLQVSSLRDRRLSEAVISGTSPLVGQSIRDADFRAVYNAAVIAVHRGGARLKGRIGDIVLRAGDTLLLQTGPHFARAHRNNTDFFLVSSIEESRPVRHDRAGLSLLLLGLLVFLMAASSLPIVYAAFLVAGLMVGTRCISASAARQSVDWQTLVTIAAAFGLGRALETSGAARGLASLLALVPGEPNPLVALMLVYLMTTVFTELITNNAAAALMFPFAMAISADYGADPRPFAVAIAFAASASFTTPIGYQTNMMVFGPGGYRFWDFVRVGAPLNLTLWLTATLLIPRIWPLGAEL